MEVPTSFCNRCKHEVIVYETANQMRACVHCDTVSTSPLQASSLDCLTERGYKFFDPFGDEIEARIRSGGCGGNCGGDGGCKSCSKKSACHPEQRKERLLPRASKSKLAVVGSQ